MAGKREGRSGNDPLALVSMVAPHVDGTVREDLPLEAVGFDSLALAELAALVEERYGVDLADGRVSGLRTVGEVADMVGRALRERRPVRPPPDLPPGIGRIQWLSERTLGPLIRWWFHLEVRGAERMPSSGPVVLCMNHESMLDIPIAVLASPRPVTFMAKRELFESRFFARLFHELGGFSVDREAHDLRAIGLGLAALRRGEALGMYPEGTRRAGTLLPFLPGAAWLALLTGASLLPAGIRGTEGAMPPGRKIPRRVPVRFAFGEPIPVPRVEGPAGRRREAERLTDEVRRAVEDLLRP